MYCASVTSLVSRLPPFDFTEFDGRPYLNIKSANIVLARYSKNAGSKEKVAIITGASSGLGRVGAERFAAEGAKVVIADVTPGDEAIEAIAAAGGEASYVACDVTDEDSVKNVVDFAVVGAYASPQLFPRTDDAGARLVAVYVDGDGLDGDNVLYKVVGVRDKVRVLLVAYPFAGLQATDAGDWFARKALVPFDADRDRDKIERYFIETESVLPHEAGPDKLTGKDVWRAYPIPETPVLMGKRPDGGESWGPSGGAIWSAPTDGLLRDALLFDVYRPTAKAGESPVREKSLAVRLTLNSDEATLTEAQIDAAVSAVVQQLQTSLQARLRG